MLVGKGHHLRQPNHPASSLCFCNIRIRNRTKRSAIWTRIHRKKPHHTQVSSSLYLQNNWWQLNTGRSNEETISRTTKQQKREEVFTKPKKKKKWQQQNTGRRCCRIQQIKYLCTKEQQKREEISTKKTEQKMTTTVKNSGRRQRRSRIDPRNKESCVQQTTKPTKTRRDFAEKNSTIQLLCASISIYQQKGKSSSILLLITCQSISSAFQYLLLPHTKSQIWAENSALLKTYHNISSCAAITEEKIGS